MTTLENIFRCISDLEGLKKQATVERSHFYVDGVVSHAILLLYDYARTFKEGSEKVVRRDL